MGPKPKPKARPKTRPLDPRGRAAALSRPAWGSLSAGGGTPAKKRKDATLFVLDDAEYDSAYFVGSDNGSDLGSF